MKKILRKIAEIVIAFGFWGSFIMLCGCAESNDFGAGLICLAAFGGCVWGANKLFPEDPEMDKA